MANKKTTTKKRSGSRGRKHSAPPPNQGLSRGVWAVIFAVLGVLTLLSLFRSDGFLLKGIQQFFSAFIGIGIFILPFTFLGASVLLILRRKGPIRLRLTSDLLLPVIFGALAHTVTTPKMAITAQNIMSFWSSGIAYETGGIFSGTLAVVMTAAVSHVGTLILLFLLFIVLLMITCNLSPAALWRIFKTPEYEYDDKEEEEKYTAAPNPVVEKAVALHAKAIKKRRRPQIDIPLDEDPPVQQDTSPIQASTAFEPIETDNFVHDEPEPKISQEPEKSAKDVLQDLEELVRSAAGNTTKPEETEKLSSEENVKLSQDLDASQKAPAPEYIYPSMALLKKGRKTGSADATHELRENSARLIDTLQSFNIDAQIINIVRGPSVTRYEITISRGVKFSKLTSLSDDIALSLGASNVRIAAIPDKLAIGIEVPNKTVQTVWLRDVLDTRTFAGAKSKLTFAVGKDITGNAVVGNIAKMPHMLIAGTTGSGKSVCINSLLISLLYKASPEEVRLIMVDPKMVELGMYNGIPHLLIPVVTDPQKAAGALQWAVGEMMKRYKLFAEAGVKKLSEYNEYIEKKKNDGEEGEWNTLPQVVIVIDELADLMMVAANEVEDAICRIAQLARAAGMHLVIATQRPSSDVITGIMKANIPSRIAFAVASQIESRIILDQTGAEKLIGNGDMLFHPLGTSKPVRVQGCFVSAEEVDQVIEFVKKTGQADYSQEIMDHIEKAAENKAGSGTGNSVGGGDDEDVLLPDAIEVVVNYGQASVSMLQRRLKLGYARAARLVDQMEERGIVGPYEGSKPRQVLIEKEDWQEMKLRQME